MLYVVVIVALYPSFKNSSELDNLTKDSPGVAALFGISGSLTSPVGWMNANVWVNFFPLIILLMTIGYGASAIAGQEKDGHLELVLSLPFSRRRVVAQKIGALTLQALILCFFTFLAVLTGRWFELDFGIWELTTATVGVLLLGIDVGLLASRSGPARATAAWPSGSRRRSQRRRISSARWRRSSRGSTRPSTSRSSTGRSVTTSSRTGCRPGASPSSSASGSYLRSWRTACSSLTTS